MSQGSRKATCNPLFQFSVTIWEGLLMARASEIIYSCLDSSPGRSIPCLRTPQMTGLGFELIGIKCIIS